MDPKTGDVLGLTGQILHRRAAVGKGEKQRDRRVRKDRESRLWLEGVRDLPADRNFVDVCDRGADTFEFLEHGCGSQRRFVIRSAYNRGIRQGHGSLHDFCLTLARLGGCLALPSRTQPELKNSLALSFPPPG